MSVTVTAARRVAAHRPQPLDANGTAQAPANRSCGAVRAEIGLRMVLGPAVQQVGEGSRLATAGRQLVEGGDALSRVHAGFLSDGGAEDGCSGSHTNFPAPARDSCLTESRGGLVRDDGAIEPHRRADR